MTVLSPSASVSVVHAPTRLGHKTASLRRSALTASQMYLLQEASSSLRNIPGCCPPASRLVGIETNPGPPRARIRAAGKDLGVAAMQSAGLALASLFTKKLKRKPKIKAPNQARITALSSSSVSAPLARGVRLSSSGLKHTPFVVTGSGYAGSLKSVTADRITHVCSRDGLEAPTNIITIDIRGNSNAASNFGFFPKAVYSISSSFSKYRIKKLILRSVPMQGSTFGGQLTMSAWPEVKVTDTIRPISVISSSDTTVSAPLWTSSVLDLTRGIDTSWKFVDTLAVLDQAQTRQEAAGSLGFFISGGQYYDQFTTSLYIDYVIEFDQICQETNFNSPPPPPPVAIQTDPIPVRPQTPRPVSDDDEFEFGTESIHLDRDALLRIRALRKSTSSV